MIRKGKPVLFFIVVVLCLLYVWPFIFILFNSLKSTPEFITNPVTLPKVLRFSNYVTAAQKMHYLSSFFNSAVVTIFSLAGIIIASAMSAWLYVRKNWKINRIMFMVMIASMLIPFQAIMIPLVKIYGSLNLLNSKISLIYMYIGFGVNLSVFMYHGFIKSIPLELEEAALIDGCSNFQIFFSIIFPMLKSMTITVITLDLLWVWNDFLLPSLVLIMPKEFTLPLSTFSFFGTYTVNFGLLMAGLVITVLPVLIAYLFLQKHITAGIAQGAIK